MKRSILLSVAAYRFRWLLVGLFCALFNTEHHFAHHDELAWLEEQVHEQVTQPLTGWQFREDAAQGIVY